MNKKIYLVLIIIISIAITVLVQTVSIVTNEHSFYQTVQEKCIKCHGDVMVQLNTSAKHSTLSCIYCHQRSTTNHTNTKSECDECHMTRLGDTLEAHSEFVQLKSDGCVACHTNYNIIVNYSRPEYIEYDITNNNGNWIISNFTTIGNINLTYNALRIGGKHNWKDSVSCVECHKDIFDAISRGGHAAVFNQTGIQVARHSTDNYPNLTAWCTNCHNKADPAFPTQQHTVRKTTCDECHETYGVGHPGNLYTNAKVVPRLYRSLFCISCKSTGWNTEYIINDGDMLHFRVYQEPSYGVSVWNETTLIAVVN